MTKPVWHTPAGFLGTITQRSSQNIPLIIEGVSSDFSIVTGSLPSGLVFKKDTTATIVNSINPSTGDLTPTVGTICYIIGNPTGVPDIITSKFTIRAKNSSGIADRTFTIDVAGPVNPIWVTDEGFLPIGTSGEYFAVNKELIDFQLVAEPNVLFTNQKMRYYIADNEGVLPPGLELSEDGRITGIIEENLVIEESTEYVGGYDSVFYDSYPYDVLSAVENITTAPKFYTKIYRFYVTATDGYSSEKRLFAVQLYDANSLRADTSYITGDSNYFASDGYMFPPYWLNPVNLGSRRASNYQIINLKVYDPFPYLGPVTFNWDETSVNPEIRALGDSPANINGAQIRNRPGDSIVYLKNITALPKVGYYMRLDTYIEADLGQDPDNTLYEIVTVEDTGDNTCRFTVRYNPRLVDGEVFYDTVLKSYIPNDQQLYIGSKSEHPLNFELDKETGNLYGKIPYIPAYSIDYKFTVRTIKTDTRNVVEQKIVKRDRIFNLRLKGDVDSTIKWVTDSLVGRIKTGYQSELFVKAEHTDNNISIQYDLIGGSLPDGFSLKRDGTLVGKLSYDTKLTYVDFGTDFQIDGGDTTIDRQFDFVVRANDIYRLGAIDKSFHIIIDDDSKIPFSSIYIRPFLSKSQRKAYRTFIENEDIFSQNILYRSSDPAFGLQDQIRMTLEFGIQRRFLAEYIYSLQNYFYTRKFYFGKVKYATAKDEHGNSVYDIVYVDIIDHLENVNSKSPDNVSFYINSNLETVFVNSVDNWQASLEGIVVDEKAIQVDEYLRPRYMRTIQSDGQPLGFIKAVPLCYVQPGAGATVVRKIELSDFDFKLFDFEVDRLIIDRTLDYPGDKYLKFPIDKITYNPEEGLLSAEDGNLASSDGEVFIGENGSPLLFEG